MADSNYTQKNDTDPMGRTVVQGWARWAGYVMCGWALIFAIMHFYWGAGGMFLEFGEHNITQINLFAWFFCAGILCVIGIVIALALIQSRIQSLPHWLMQASSLSGGAILIFYLVSSYLAQGLHWMLACGILCIVGAVLALALTQPWGQYISRWLMLLFVWLGGIVLTLHALYGYVVHGLVVGGVITWEQNQQWIGAPVTPMSADTIKNMIMQNMLIWNPWFLVGGILFLAVAWQASRRRTGQVQGM